MRNYLTSGVLCLALMISGILTASNAPAFDEFGMASYYSDAFQGKKTASGELYDMNKFTAAHKSLPFGTIILITRLDNKKSVKVRVIDRGPYIKGRIVDVSKAAAKKLDLITDGTARVKIEVVGEGTESKEDVSISPPPTSSSQSSSSTLKNLRVKEEQSASVPESRPEEYADRSVGLPRTPPIVESTKTNVKPKNSAKAPAKKVKEAPKAKAVAPASTAKRVRGKDFQLYDLYKIQLLRPEKSGFGVQVASYMQYEYVMKQVAELQESWFNNILVSVEKGKNNEPVYKIILGPFADRATAESYKKELKRNKKIDGFVVDLKE